jgi:hypothetical protein
MIRAEIVGHSLSPQGDELITVLATFPRHILAEVNTHRMLSKNTSSSRAIPFNKLLEMVQENPFIPIAWQKEHKGMQGTEYWEGEHEILDLRESWLISRDRAIEGAKDLHANKVTKQLCNRLIEPFMWTTMLITGPKSGWDNFFKLRCPSYTFHTDESENDFIFKSKKDAIKHFPKDEVVEYETGNVLLKDLTDLQWLKANKGQAEIHMMALAECIYDAVKESTPKQLESREWHIPFEDKIKINPWDFNEGIDNIKISVAMAARTSYTVVGEEKEINYENLIGLHDRLLTQDPPHSSPFEHCARAMSDEEYYAFKRGWMRKTNLDAESGWCNNLKGFIPYRYLVDNSLSL